MNASSVDFFRDILFAPSAPFPALEKLWQVFERCCERRRKLKGGWFLGWFISGALLHPFPSSFLLFPLPHESVMSLSWGAAASLNSSWGAVLLGFCGEMRLGDWLASWLSHWRLRDEIEGEETLNGRYYWDRIAVRKKSQRKFWPPLYVS